MFKIAYANSKGIKINPEYFVKIANPDKKQAKPMKILLSLSIPLTKINTEASINDKSGISAMILCERTINAGAEINSKDESKPDPQNLLPKKNIEITQIVVKGR